MGMCLDKIEILGKQKVKDFSAALNWKLESELLACLVVVLVVL